ncbi:MAG: cytidine/deoxycytidylate deaminase family protein [Candidatus Pacearchaeota archaeon]|jgi:dCMP deaminase
MPKNKIVQAGKVKKMHPVRKNSGRRHSFRKSTSIEEELRELANTRVMYFESAEDYQNRPSWDEIFMLSAYESATRASCLHLKTGAVLVKDKRIIASGYNGAPQRNKSCLEIGCRKDLLGISQDHKRTGNCRGAHAERNAMDQIAREGLKGVTLYTVMFPCSDCAKTIVGNGIVEVVYSMIYKEPDSLTKESFAEAGIKLREYHPDIEKQFIRLMRVYNQRYLKDFSE